MLDRAQLLVRYLSVLMAGDYHDRLIVSLEAKGSKWLLF